MKKALIDLDDVLAVDGFLNMLNVFNKSDYSYSDIKSYYVEEILPIERQKEFRNYFREHNVYDYAHVAPHSKEVLKNLMLEYEIYICSNYCDMDNHIMPELIPKKIEFLLKNFPFLTSANFIFANDKTVIKGDLRIDDKLSNLKTDGIKLLYSAYHNLNISNEDLQENEILRVNDWKEIENELNKQKVFTIK